MKNMGFSHCGLAALQMSFQALRKLGLGDALNLAQQFMGDIANPELVT